MKSDLRRLVAHVQPSSTGAEFFPAVGDLTEMIDHWKENTDMDTHDLVEGVIGYFGAPVQPSAVVSQDEIVETLNNAWDSVPGQSDFSDPNTIDIQADAIFSLQLPQPVAPIQSGGVDSHRWNIEETENGIRLCRGKHERSSECEWEEFVSESHLTTTQSATLIQSKVGDA